MIDYYNNWRVIVVVLVFEVFVVKEVVVVIVVISFAQGFPGHEM